MYIRLFIIAITPALIGTFCIYQGYRRDRESGKLLFLTFILGALAVIPSIPVEEILIRLNVFDGILGAFFNAFIVAALTEEYFKRLVILKLPMKTSYFNEKLDGIVYGAFAALGFATVENIIYVVFRYTNNPFIGLNRGIFSVPAHAVFGVTMGYYLSLYKFNTDEKDKRSNLIKSLFMPVLLHGVFDFILMADIPQLTFLFVPYVVFLWWSNHRKFQSFKFDSKNRIIDEK